MKMKKLVSAIVALAMLVMVFGGITIAQAATVDDIVPVGVSETYWFDDYVTAGVSAGDLIGDDHFYSPSGNDYAINKGSHTVDDEIHLNCLRIKSIQKTLTMKTEESCSITIYTQYHSTRGLVVTTEELSDAYTSYDAAVADMTSGKVVAVQPVSTTEVTFPVNGGETLYISGYSLDFYIAGIKTEPIPTVDYTINYTINGKSLFSDTGEGAVGSTVYAETELSINSTKYQVFGDAATSMTLTEGENVLNVPLAKVVDYTINYTLNDDIIYTFEDTWLSGGGIVAETYITVDGIKYYPTDDAVTSMTLKDSDNVFEVPVRKANNYTVTVKATGDVEKVFDEWTVVEGNPVLYFYPRYILDGTTLYETASQNGGYYVTNSNVVEDETFELTYTEVADKEIVYFSEAEDITGATELTPSHCLSGAGARFVSSTNVTTLPAGRYKITAGAYSATTNIFKFTVGDNVFTAPSATGYSETTSEEFILTEDTAVTVSGGATNIALDYIIIERTGSSDTADTNGEIAVEMSDALTNYISDTNKATGFTASFTNIGDSMHLVQNLTWTITPENADGVEIPVELGTIMTLKSGAGAVAGIVLDGLYDENATASVKIG